MTSDKHVLKARNGLETVFCAEPLTNLFDFCDIFYFIGEVTCFSNVAPLSDAFGTVLFSNFKIKFETCRHWELIL